MGNAALKGLVVSETPSSSGGLSLMWSIYDAKSTTGGQQSSVFVLDKRTVPERLGLNPHEAEALFELAKHEAVLLARLRHPSVLRLRQSLQNTRNALVLVTEPVICSLANFLGELKGFDLIPKRISEVSLNEMQVKSGLRQIGEALRFLHYSAGMLHLGVDPANVYLTPDGAWKLSGFTFALQSHDSSLTTKGSTPSFHPMLSGLGGFSSSSPSGLSLLPSLSYSAPELVHGADVDERTDTFSLAMVIRDIYRRMHKLQLNKVLDCRNYQSHIAQLPRCVSEDSSIESSLKPVLQAMLVGPVSRRMDINRFLVSAYFRDIPTRTLRYLEHLIEKETSARVAFLRRLPNALSMFEPATLLRRVLPPIQLQVQDEATTVFALPSLLAMEPLLTRDSFHDNIWTPILRPFLTRPLSPRNKQSHSQSVPLLLLLLRHIPLLLDHASASDRRDLVLPLLLSSLASQHNNLRERALNSIMSTTASTSSSANAFGQHELRDKVIPRVRELCSSANASPEVRIASLRCVSHLLPSLDQQTICEQVLGSLDDVLQPPVKDVCVLDEALKLYEALVQSQTSLKVLSSQIVPKILVLSLHMNMPHPKLKRSLDIVRAIVDRIEKERAEEFKKFEFVQREQNLLVEGHLTSQSGHAEMEIERLFDRSGSPPKPLPQQRPSFNLQQQQHQTHHQAPIALQSNVGQTRARADPGNVDLFSSLTTSPSHSPTRRQSTEQAAFPFNTAPAATSNASIQDPFSGLQSMPAKLDNYGLGSRMPNPATSLPSNPSRYGPGKPAQNRPAPNQDQPDIAWGFGSSSLHDQPLQIRSTARSNDQHIDPFSGLYD